MLTKVECVILNCDSCKEGYIDDSTGFSIFVDENQAHENAGNDEWYQADGKAYCPKCYHIDKDDNLIIKQWPCTIPEQTT